MNSVSEKEAELNTTDKWAGLWSELYSTMSDSHIELIKEQKQAMFEARQAGEKPEISRFFSFIFHMVFMAYHGQLKHKLTLPTEVAEILIRYPRYPRLRDTIYCRQCLYPLPVGEIGETTWITCPVCGALMDRTLDYKSDVRDISK